MCCRRKRCCFAKSSPNAGTGATGNAYDLEPVAENSSPSRDQGTTPSAAATDDRVYYNDSAAVIAGLAPASGNGALNSNIADEHRDSGLTLVDNALYQSSESKPDNGAVYENAPFQAADHPPPSAHIYDELCE